MTHRTKAKMALACSIACMPAIAIYGSTHEGTALDQVVVWALVVLGFVLILTFGYQIAQWEDTK